jgi:hypothetical protein
VPFSPTSFKQSARSASVNGSLEPILAMFLSSVMIPGSFKIILVTLPSICQPPAIMVTTCRGRTQFMQLMSPMTMRNTYGDSGIRSKQKRYILATSLEFASFNSKENLLLARYVTMNVLLQTSDERTTLIICFPVTLL